MAPTLETYFTPAFIESVMQQRYPAKSIAVTGVRPFAVDNRASILVTLTAGTSTKRMGHFGLQVEWQEDGLLQSRKMVMKMKPHGREISAMLNGLAQACGEPLASTYPSFAERTGFQHTHGRELEVYRKLSDAILPTIYDCYEDHRNEVYLILMEYLEEVTLLNSVMEVHRWTDTHIKTALAQLAQWHARYLLEPPALDAQYWSDTQQPDYFQQLSPLWEALLTNAQRQLPTLYTAPRAHRLAQAIAAIPRYQAELQEMPTTLVHNDLNPRNTCFRGDQFCAYDWELATFHVPQYDVVELLCFVLDHDRYAQRETYLEYYRAQLHQHVPIFSDQAAFKHGFQLAALDFGLHRLGLYSMAHCVSPYPFLPRVINSYFDTIQDIDLP
ncbi:MAG: aminoglycoside phosphotransferase family protein [Tunicatimonas sp.]